MGEGPVITVDMELANARPLHNNHPSFSSTTSETPSASSDISLPRSFPSFQDRSLDTVPALTPSRNIRKLVINSSVPPPLFHQPIRRKPLSSTASPIATRYSSGGYLSIASGLPRPEQRYSRSFSVDSPTVYEFQSTIGTVAGWAKFAATPTLAPVEDTATETYVENSPEVADFVPSMRAVPAAVPAGGEVKHPSFTDINPAAPETAPTASQHVERTAHDGPLAEAEEADSDEDSMSVLDDYDSDSSYNSNSNSHNMSLSVTRKAASPHLNHGPSDLPFMPSVSPTNANNHTPNTDKPLPKSPVSSKLGNFFGWGSPSPSATEFSDKGFSPVPSSFNLSRSNTYPDASPITTLGPTRFLEAPKAQTGSSDSGEYSKSYLETPPAAAASLPAQIEDMEEELKAISAELASSVRREMDLEDLVDRLQAERDNPTSITSKRTSDYFSDSGYSSAKFSDYDQTKEEIEKIQRRAEQEKAQVTLELTNKLGEERTRRQQLDEQIKMLSQKASQVDLAQLNSVDASDRVRELENTCEILRRKLSEERSVKDNFEDLFSALKGELQNASNERDNLRDEIVPQLRARVEGLEVQAIDLEKMTYESSKMQQELQVLKVENTSLKQAKSIGSIAEEPGPLPGPLSRPIFGSRLSRSSSITGPPSSFRPHRPPSLAGLSRSKSVKSAESRDQLSDRLKDVEEQRDALHRALKALLERQECQNRENEKKIRSLERERDHLLTSLPQKAGFVKEVTNLRGEISVLRRRSEEALEQKWQVEKGLAGLKTDLDRAEQEIASLKSLLAEKDILIPESFARHSGSSDTPPVQVTSESLMTAHRDMQNAYADSLDRIKNLELDVVPSDERTRLAVKRLEQALASAVIERNVAKQEASSYRSSHEECKASEQMYLESENALADELQDSVRRVEELAIQVRQQLYTNQNLRQRLNDTVARGEADQKAHVKRITTMQERLRSLEEQLVAAQTATEDRIARHEEDISTLRESHNQHLSRLSVSALRSPRLFPPKSPLSPIFATSARSPRFSATRAGPAQSVSDETQVATLRARVAELEKALVSADFEMQEVVGRMNTAQIEVMELQEAREAAVSQTRKLERELQAEQVKVFEDRFQSLKA